MALGEIMHCAPSLSVLRRARIKGKIQLPRHNTGIFPRGARAVRETAWAASEYNSAGAGGAGKKKLGSLNRFYRLELHKCLHFRGGGCTGARLKRKEGEKKEETRTS